MDDDRLLDAARECVLAIGVRRTTLTEVARRAGVSRMTLYRRFPDVRSLVAALMTREFGALLLRATRSDATDDEPCPHARAELVRATVRVVRLLDADPLLRIVLELDAELLLPYVVQRLGSTQRIAEQFLLDQLRAGHADGSVRFGDPRVQARMILLTAQSVLLSLRPATTDLDREALLDELATQLDGALRPAVVEDGEVTR
ncbi:MAG TPA: helix-turn-helix domain-containing protein [Pseudonocardiaceae bacterium]